jgi:hypothetical protein
VTYTSRSIANVLLLLICWVPKLAGGGFCSFKIASGSELNWLNFDNLSNGSKVPIDNFKFGYPKIDVLAATFGLDLGIDLISL